MATMIARPGAAGSKLRCNLRGGDVYFNIITFEFAGSTNDPDTVNPSNGVTLAHSSTGVYTLTFDENVKPKSIVWGDANLAENQADWRISVGEYVPSTGVLTFYAIQDDATTGVPANADIDDGFTCKMILLCSDSSLSDLQG